MKKWILLLLLSLAALPVAAQTTLTLASGGIGVSCNAVGTATSLNPGTLGGCISFALLTSGSTLPVVYTWQTLTTGSPSGLSVTLVGSLDGVTWTTLDTATTATTRTTTGTAYRFLGCVPGTLSGGSSPTVTCQISVSSGTTGGGGGGSGTVSANNGSVGAVANYAAAAGSTTVGPDATLVDDGTTVTASGTGGVSATAGPLSSGSVGTAGVVNWKGSTSGTATCTAPAVAGTASNVVSCSNNMSVPEVVLSSGTTVTASVAGLNANYLYDDGGTSVFYYKSGAIFEMLNRIFHPKGGNLAFVASNFTTAANTSLQTITGLSFTTPVRADNFNFHCSLAYSQAIGTAAVAFGIQAATNAPTNIFATGKEYTAAGTVTTGVLATLTTTTATAIVSGTPGGTGTNLPVDLDGTLELAASANTINFMVSTATSGDAVTVLRGSYCMIF